MAAPGFRRDRGADPLDKMSDPGGVEYATSGFRAIAADDLGENVEPVDAEVDGNASGDPSMLWNSAASASQRAPRSQEGKRWPGCVARKPARSRSFALACGGCPAPACGPPLLPSCGGEPVAGRPPPPVAAALPPPPPRGPCR
mmetsp:Transcript_97582/g.303463  ORF Transcript_97582/g.303463 Transcript_97582/m.303463 type:complete len:143 (+) Transcript_97582:117-545(+)